MRYRCDTQRRSRIQDIIEAAEMAARSTAEGRSAFYDDWKNMPVAAQMISIIGAAASRLSDTATASYPDIPWDDIRGMRNFIAHEYHNIEPEIVWETLRTSIPELVRSLGEEPVRRQPSRGPGLGM